MRVGAVLGQSGPQRSVLGFKTIDMCSQVAHLSTQFADDLPERVNEPVFFSVTQATELGQVFHEGFLGIQGETLSLIAKGI